MRQHKPPFLNLFDIVKCLTINLKSTFEARAINLLKPYLLSTTDVLNQKNTCQPKLIGRKISNKIL